MAALAVQSEIYLDVKQRNIQKVITAHQYDNNSRYILAHIIDDGVPLNISNYNIMFKAFTQDGRAILIDDCEKQYETGDVIIKLSESLLCSAGKHMGEVIIYNDTTTLTTMKFTLIVEGSVYDDERLVSSDDFSAIRKMINDIENLEDTIADISTIQNDQRTIQTNLDNAISDVNDLKESIQDKIDEVDIKVTELENTVDEADDAIQQFRNNSTQLQNDINQAETLIAQVGDVVEDDTMVRKAQLGIESNEYVTGVATLDENAKLTASQFPYEILRDDEVDDFILNCLGQRTIKLDNVEIERDLVFESVEDNVYDELYLLLE